MKREIFYPESVAIIGASQDTGKAGHQLMKSLLDEGFTGTIYPVHPREEEILGLKCYKTLKDIEDTVDLIIISIPAFAVLDVMQEAAERGDVKTAIIISAGFSETAIPERVDLEKEIVELAHKNNIRIFGPNCNGFINTENKFTTSFAPGQNLSPGDIGFITQSGSFGGSVMMMAAEEPKSLGFNKWSHLGNMADVTNMEILESYETDPKINVVGLYMEGVREGRELMEIGSRVSREKPVLTIKVGRTELGSKAALSHTGTLAGSDQVYDTAFKQSGIVRVETIEELVDGLKATSMLPRASSSKIAILTECGGPGIISMDEIDNDDVAELAHVSTETVEKLKEALPPMAMVCKPDGYIDMTAAALEKEHADAMRLLLDDPGVDSLLVISLPPTFLPAEGVAEVIAEVAAEYDKPVAACFMKGEDMEPSRKYLEEHGVPTFETPERSARALINNIKCSLEIKSDRVRGLKPQDKLLFNKDKFSNLITEFTPEERNPLEPEVYDFLEKYEIDLLPHSFVASRDEALAKAEELGYPLVMKVVSPQVIHKSDVGGVKLNLKNSEEVGKAYDGLMADIKKNVPNADIKGVILTPMAAGGLEVIIGVTRDPQFGPTVMFGLGGVFVEVFKDISFRIAPFTEEDAREMIEETRAYQLLKGVRGEKPKDIEALAELLVKIGDLVTLNPAIKELDLNPVMVQEDGFTILDARIITD